jgi:4-amino-4-deoxy-L-arabinose transferase-like glycosyltransferase
VLGVSYATTVSANSDRKVRFLWGWGGSSLAFILPFVTYLRTLAPTVYGLDSAELTTAAYCLGLVHSPGYPLYLLIGHLFTQLPFGNVGYRVNLMSAFFGALAITLLYLLLLKLTRQPLTSLAASLFLAYSFFFWSPSVMAEVYTLHVFLMAALVLIVLTWQEQQDSRWLYLFAFLYGLSLGNHLSTLLLAPGLLYWLLATDYRQLLRPRHILVMLALFALGLSVYIYLPLRYAAHPPPVGAMQIRVTSWQDALEVISARAFWRLVFAYRWPKVWGQMADYLYCLWGNFLGVGLVIGVVGGVVAFQRRRNLTAALALMYLANAVFFIGYRVGDKRIMFLPTYFIWAVWIGLGYDWLLEQVSYLAEGAAATRRLQGVVHVLFLVLSLAALVINFQYADLSDDWRTYERAIHVFETVEPDAYILAASWFEVAPLEYLHVVEQRRPDVKVLNGSGMSLFELYAFVESERDTHPFYSTADPGWLAVQYELEYIERCNCYRIK